MPTNQANQKQSKQQRRKKARKGKSTARAVAVPAAISTIRSQRSPQITSRGPVFRVKHREMVFALSGGFSITSKRINPANPALFPWLSGIAKMYERYRFVSCKFDYVPVCPTTTVGGRAAAIDYDPADELPIDVQTLMSYKTAISSPLWAKQSMNLDIPSAFRDTPTKFTRTKDADVYTPFELRTTDCGSLIYCHTGSGNADIVGWMFVDYIIDLYEPQIPTGGDASGAAISAVNDASHTLLSAAHPYGTAPVVKTSTFSIDVDTKTSPPTFSFHDATPGTFIQLVEEVVTRGAAVKSHLPTILSGLTLFNDMWTALAGNNTVPINSTSSHPSIYRVDSTAGSFTSGFDFTGVTSNDSPSAVKLLASVVPSFFGI